MNRKVAESLVITGAFDRLGENRATLHAQPRPGDGGLRAVPRGEAIRPGVALRRARRRPPRRRSSWNACPSCPASRLLQEERQNLGFFFSGHPLDPVAGDHLARRHGGPLEEGRIRQRSLLRPPRDPERREGDTHAQREDDGVRPALRTFRGSIELILFSDIYESRRALIANDAIVGVRGKIDTTRGDAKVKVDDITDPASLPQKPAQAVHVRLKDEVGTEESLHTHAGVPAGPAGDMLAVLPRRQRSGGPPPAATKIPPSAATIRLRRRQIRLRRRGRRAGLLPDPCRRHRGGAGGACASTPRWRTYGQSEDRPCGIRDRRGELLPAAHRQRARSSPGGWASLWTCPGSACATRPAAAKVEPGTRVVPGLARDPGRPRCAHRGGAGRRRGQSAAPHPRGALAAGST